MHYTDPQNWFLFNIYVHDETINKLYQEIYTHVKEICFLLYIHKETQDEITWTKVFTL